MILSGQRTRYHEQAETWDVLILILKALCQQARQNGILSAGLRCARLTISPETENGEQERCAPAAVLFASLCAICSRWAHSSKMMSIALPHLNHDPSANRVFTLSCTLGETRSREITIWFRPYKRAEAECRYREFERSAVPES